MSRLIDGRAIAAQINAEVTERAAELTAAGVVPTLAVVLATEDGGAAWYVRSIERAAGRLGLACQVHRLEPTASTEQLGAVLDRLSADPTVHGVICQTPLPDGVDQRALVERIAVAKDVDGANPASLGRLAAGVPGGFAPATAAAVLEILRRENVPLTGARAVVVGRSTVVGKPAALLLLDENATVTVCHSRTKDLAAVCREADVLVAAVGRAGLVGAEHVRPGAVVIDVGTNPTEDGSLVGDVDTAAVQPVAAALTPVPGGVGPVTTALLMRHTVTAASTQTARG